MQLFTRARGRQAQGLSCRRAAGDGRRAAGGRRRRAAATSGRAHSYPWLPLPLAPPLSLSACSPPSLSPERRGPVVSLVLVVARGQRAERRAGQQGRAVQCVSWEASRRHGHSGAGGCVPIPWPSLVRACLRARRAGSATPSQGPLRKARSARRRHEGGKNDEAPRCDGPLGSVARSRRRVEARRPGQRRKENRGRDACVPVRLTLTPT